MKNLNVYICANGETTGPWPREHVLAQYGQLATNAIYRADDSSQWLPISQLRTHGIAVAQAPAIGLPYRLAMFAVLAGFVIAFMGVIDRRASAANAEPDTRSASLGSPGPAAETDRIARIDALTATNVQHVNDIAECERRFTDPNTLGRDCCERAARGATPERNRKHFTGMYGVYRDRYLPAYEQSRSYEILSTDLLNYRDALPVCGIDADHPLAVEVTAAYSRIRRLQKTAKRQAARKSQRTGSQG